MSICRKNLKKGKKIFYAAFFGEAQGVEGGGLGKKQAYFLERCAGVQLGFC